MHNRPLFRLAAAVLLATALPAAAQDVEATADTVVATVNGEEITLGHMIALRARLPEQYQNLPNDVLFNGLLDQLVQQSVLAGGADALNRENTLILENESRSLLAAQVYEKVAEEAASEDALQAAYDAAFADVAPEAEYDASHILVDTQEEAIALVAELEAGADFAELARQKSTGPSGPNGGALGWFGPGMMVAPFEAAVVALDVGEISQPVETQFGWHVVKLNDKRNKAAPTLEQVRPQLTNDLQRAAIEALLADETATSDITRIDPATIDVELLSDTSLLTE